MTKKTQNINTSIKLNNIFKKKFNIDFDSGIYDEESHLLGKNIRLFPRDLLNLYIYIEDEFNITISQQEIADEKFSDFNSILSLIENSLGSKK